MFSTSVLNKHDFLGPYMRNGSVDNMPSSKFPYIFSCSKSVYQDHLSVAKPWQIGPARCLGPPVSLSIIDLTFIMIICNGSMPYNWLKLHYQMHYLSNCIMQNANESENFAAVRNCAHILIFVILVGIHLRVKRLR